MKAAIFALMFVFVFGAQAFPCSACIEFWDSLRELTGCSNNGIVCPLAEKLFNANATQCQSIVNFICSAGCSADPNTCSIKACKLLRCQNSTSSCLVPNKDYKFPVQPLTGDYFQWLRQISDSQTLSHFSTATPQQMTDFMKARVAHIFQHLNHTTGPHTVCLPDDFVNTADQNDVRHWLTDYSYLNRLVRLFPSIPIQRFNLDTIMSKIMFAPLKAN